MTFDGALIKEQGVTFAIIVVKSYVLSSPSAREELRNSFSDTFPNTPIILMDQDNKGVPTYQGRKDIVNFLVNIDINQIPWKEYSVS